MTKKKDEPFGGVYENMDFAPYEYQHYPLMMRKGTSKLSETKVVNNEAEERAAEEEGFKAPERVGPPISLTEKEHKGLTDEIAELKRQLAMANSGRTELAPPASGEHPVPLAGAKPPETQPGVALRAPASPSGAGTAAVPTHPPAHVKPAAPVKA